MSFKRTLLAVLVVLSAACDRSPQAKESKFLSRGTGLLKGDPARAVLEFKNAATVMPTDSEPYFQMGVALLREAKAPDAAAAFQKALELNPNHAGAKAALDKLVAEDRKNQLIEDAGKKLKNILGTTSSIDAADALAYNDAETKLTQKDLDGAVDILNRAAARHPKASKIDWALGELYFMMGRHDKAEPEIRKYLELDPKHGEALLTLASIQVAGQHWQEADVTYRRLAALPDKQYKPVHAAFLHARGQLDASLAEYEQLYRADPRDTDARGRLVTLYVATNKLSEAIKLLDQTVKEHPADPQAYQTRAELLLRANRLDEAEKDARQVLSFQANSVPAQVVLAAVARKRSLGTAERKALADALQTAPQSIQVRLQLAKSLLRDNQAKTALDILNEAPVDQAKAPQLLEQKNWALLELGKNEEVEANLGSVLRRDWTRDMPLQEAVVKYRKKDYSAAQKSVEEALKSKVADERAAALLVRIYTAQNQSDEGLRRLAAIAASHPKSPDLQFLLGNSYENIGRLKEARAAYTAAKAANPYFQKADLALADLDSRENPDAARRRLAEILHADPKNVAALLLWAGVEEKAGQRAEAMAKYRSVLGFDEANVVALNNLAYLLAFDDPDQALKLAQQAAQLAPANPGILDTLGWVYYRKGDYRAAVEQLKTAVAKAPTPQREFHLAMSYLKAGDKSTGDKMLASALQKDENLKKNEPGW
jgi:tetratricopeptide (TPR) repeat protein